MRHDLSRIKQEMCALYAAAHPEARLEDIGLVLGWKRTAAVSMAGFACRRFGVVRKAGAGSPAFDREAIAGAKRKYDHAAILRILERRPDLPYEDIALEAHCPQGVVSYVAQHNHLARGVKRRRRGL